MILTRISPAKVNLYLRVLRKREDGYHDILSLMQKISLCDEMTFSTMDPTGRIAVSCPGSSLPEDRGNIVYRAAEAFFSRCGNLPGVKITIRKTIPVAAGLGGGSSNAATTLLTLNELAGNPLNRETLMDMGAKLGADVPFFIFGNTAWVSGVGDRFLPTDPIPPLCFVLVNPGFDVSTKMVYQSLNLGLTNGSIKYSIPRFYTAKDLIRGLTNDLERVTVRLHPVIDHIKDVLLKNGATGALMSGSGPTVFGIFASEESAIKAEDAVRRQKDGWAVFRANSL